jgi:hypothetical protein
MPLGFDKGDRVVASGFGVYEGMSMTGTVTEVKPNRNRVYFRRDGRGGSLHFPLDTATLLDAVPGSGYRVSARKP